MNFCSTSLDDFKKVAVEVVCDRLIPPIGDFEDKNIINFEKTQQYFLLEGGTNFERFDKNEIKYGSGY